ncbi:MAG TPA: flagellar basal body rod protein FlgB [Firmicutes bacterium]|nr:flagellar basal body rod protein FlgB [Bacillota bacterium]
MIDGIFSSEIYQILEKSLNASSMQHKMIANNIANVETPGYKRSEVVFQNKLAEILDNSTKTYMPLYVTHAKHIPVMPNIKLGELQPEIVTRTEMSLRTDGNNVDIDSEMASLAENTAAYSTLAQLTSTKLGMLKTAISDGRR